MGVDIAEVSRMFSLCFPDMHPTESNLKLLSNEFWERGVPTVSDLVEHGLPAKPTDFSSIPDFENDSKFFILRKFFASHFSCSVPQKEAFEIIRKHSTKLLEVGAGTGFWAKLLSQSGFDIIATDPGEDNSPRKRGSQFAVEPLDGISAVQAYPERDLLCVWPYQDCAWLTTACELLRPGAYVFAIGEFGGCCGDESFDNLVSDETKFVSVEYYRMVGFPMIRDRLYVYRRI